MEWRIEHNLDGLWTWKMSLSTVVCPPIIVAYFIYFIGLPILPPCQNIRLIGKFSHLANADTEIVDKSRKNYSRHLLLNCLQLTHIDENWWTHLMQEFHAIYPLALYVCLAPEGTQEVAFLIRGGTCPVLSAIQPGNQSVVSIYQLGCRSAEPLLRAHSGPFFFPLIFQV